MNEFELDLDTYAPKPHIVKLNDKPVEVFPPRFKNVVNLMSIIGEMQKPGADQAASVGKLKEALYPVMPALKDDDIDITMEQLGILVEFLFKLATPPDSEKLKEAGITPMEQAEKKED